MRRRRKRECLNLQKSFWLRAAVNSFEEVARGDVTGSGKHACTYDSYIDYMCVHTNIFIYLVKEEEKVVCSNEIEMIELGNSNQRDLFF